MAVIISAYGILSAASCRKDVPGGTQIEATGFVYDTVLQQRVPNAMVYLIGERLGGGLGARIYPDTGYVAVTQADAQGNFSISYRAQGNYYGYVLGLGYDAAFGGYTGFPENYIPDYMLPFYSFSNGFRKQGVELKARFLEPARLTLTDGNRDTVILTILAVSGDLYKNIPLGPLPADTTVRIWLLPGTRNAINYYVNYGQTPVGTDSLSPVPGDTLQLTHHF
jgi:hypothetical protein